MTHRLVLHLGEFTIYALEGEEGPTSNRVRANAKRALRYYRAERDSGRPDWRSPDFLPRAVDDETIELEIELDDVLWRWLEREAAEQGVQLERLAEHAVLYFAADLDAGRLSPERLAELDR
jgi:hypothetical protein